MATFHLIHDDESDADSDFESDISSHDSREALDGGPPDLDNFLSPEVQVHDRVITSSLAQKIPLNFNPVKDLKLQTNRVYNQVIKNLAIEGAALRLVRSMHLSVNNTLKNDETLLPYAKSLLKFIKTEKLEHQNDEKLKQLTDGFRDLLLTCLLHEAVENQLKKGTSDMYGDCYWHDPNYYFDMGEVFEVMEPFFEPLIRRGNGRMFLIRRLIDLADQCCLEGQIETRRQHGLVDRTALIALRTDYLQHGKMWRESYLYLLQLIRTRQKSQHMFIMRKEFMFNTHRLLWRIHRFATAQMMVYKALIGTMLPLEISMLVRDAVCSFGTVVAASKFENRPCPWRYGEQGCHCNFCLYVEDFYSASDEDDYDKWSEEDTKRTTWNHFVRCAKKVVAFKKTLTYCE